MRSKPGHAHVGELLGLHVDASRAAPVMLGPYPVKYAREWIEKVHRRIPVLTGAMWCVGLWVGDEMRGLAVVGRPARMLDVPARRRIPILNVLRVAVLEGTPNGCSALYGACSRVGRDLGADGMMTHIHADETGVSLKASGWVRESDATLGGECDRPHRRRKPALDAGPKWRWWAPWSLRARELVPACSCSEWGFDGICVRCGRKRPHLARPVHLTTR